MNGDGFCAECGAPWSERTRGCSRCIRRHHDRRLAGRQFKSAESPPTLLDRLGDKFVFSPDGCWLWTGALVETGYGVIWQNRRHYRAHRIVYELVKGPIPEGLELDHLCRVRRCVNPSHLEPVTHRENSLRGPQSTRGKTRCSRGHELAGVNIRLERDGLYRRCRACDRENTRAHRARRRAEAALSTASEES